MVIKTLIEIRSRTHGDNCSAVRDLLTDIIHFCELHNLDFDKSCRAAKDVAAEELLCR